MNAYLIVWDESDGNDCSVYDTVVLANSQDDATSLLSESIEETLTNNGTEWQDDGNILGYMYGCSDNCSENCEGHGGTNLREVTEYGTEDEARANMSKWHTEYVVS